MPNSKHKPKVLIVDDDTDLVDDLRLMLASEFDVVSAETTPEAHRRWAKTRPECVLLDLNMPVHYGTDPKCEGLSFLESARHDANLPRAAQMPVIIITMEMGQDNLKRADKLGIKGVYEKPLDLKRLKAAIWSAVDEGRLELTH